MRTLRKVLQSICRNGIVQTIKLVRKNIVYNFRWYLDGEFDRSHGVDTSDHIELEALHVVGCNRNSGVYYEPTPTRIFAHIMGKLDRIISFQDFEFIDYGSGKGRTLLLASNYTFKSVLGIEFSPELHSIAMKNIRAYRTNRQRCKAIISVNSDAALFSPPTGNLLVYFYNPFKGNVMRDVLRNLALAANENDSKIALVYLNPLSSKIIEGSGIFQSRAKIPLPYDYTREQQRKCYVYFSWPVAQGDLQIQPVQPAMN